MNDSNVNFNDSAVESDYCAGHLLTLYVIPAISVVGFLLNSMSTFVLSRIVLKNSKINMLFKILYTKSLLQMTLLFINSFMPIYYCFECEISSSLITQIWYIYFFNFFEDVLINLIVIFEVCASFYCYLSIVNKFIIFSIDFSKISMRIFLLTVSLVTIANSSPIIFRFRIIQLDTNSKYDVVNTEYFNTTFDTYLRFVQSILRDFVSLIVLVTLQFILVYTIRIHVVAKKNISHSANANANAEAYLKNSILTVLCTGIIFIVGHIPLSIYYLPLDKSNKSFWSCYYFISLLPFYLSYLPTFFIYSFFNKVFAKNLKEIFKLQNRV